MIRTAERGTRNGRTDATRRPSRITWLPGPRSAFLVPLAILLGLACGPSQKNTDLRQWTDDLTFRISTDPMPPRAREKIAFKVVVQDKESRQPIERGEGRIFATSKDRKNVWDILEPTPEPGTYRASLSFLTAGDWAVANQFSRDSTQKLERVALKGRYLGPFARILLAIMHLREKQPTQALAVLNNLSRDFPQNPLFRNEARKLTEMIESGRR